MRCEEPHGKPEFVPRAARTFWARHALAAAGLGGVCCVHVTALWTHTEWPEQIGTLSLSLMGLVLQSPCLSLQSGRDDKVHHKPAVQVRGEVGQSHGRGLPSSGIRAGHPLLMEEGHRVCELFFSFKVYFFHESERQRKGER